MSGLVTGSLLQHPTDGIRAPRENNQAVVAPARDRIEACIATNRKRLEHAHGPNATWVRDVRRMAKSELLPMAQRYVRSYLKTTHRENTAALTDAPWIVGGHQPELFHSGVWFKNFFIDSLAKSTGSLGLHAIVDHDLARAITLRVPAFDEYQQRVLVRSIPLPVANPHPFPIAWNALHLDQSAISGTRQGIEDALRSVGIQHAIAHEFFNGLEGLPAGIDVATAFSQLRHTIEARHGLSNLELPISQLSASRTWHAFLHHCIVHSESLHSIYNRCLHRYREAERISNPAQPVPALMDRDDWIELPFWWQSADHPTRQRLWVRPGPEHWLVASQPSPSSDETVLSWPTNEDRSADVWSSAQQAGVRIWPRALMTTLFLRTLVADLFVHGIGGGVYDRLTDAILEQFLGVEPPEFVTCTATLLLDIQHPGGTDCDDWELQHQRLSREGQLLRSRPEGHLDPENPEQKRLLEQHAKMLRTMPPRGHKRAWHQQMVQLKSQITQSITSAQRDLEQRRASHDGLAQELRALHSREYSFLLFEEQDVIARLKQLAV